MSPARFRVGSWQSSCVPTAYMENFTVPASGAVGIERKVNSAVVSPPSRVPSRCLGSPPLVRQACNCSGRSWVPHTLCLVTEPGSRWRAHPQTQSVLYRCPWQALGACVLASHQLAMHWVPAALLALLPLLEQLPEHREHVHVHPIAKDLPRSADGGRMARARRC